MNDNNKYMVLCTGCFDGLGGGVYKSNDANKCPNCGGAAYDMSIYPVVPLPQKPLIVPVDEVA